MGRYANNKLPDVSDRYIRYIGNRTDKWLQYHTMEDAIRNITGAIGQIDDLSGEATGAFSKTFNVGMGWGQIAGGGGNFIDFDASRVVPTADENRPKTITIRARIVKALP